MSVVEGGLFADLCAKIDLQIGSVTKLTKTVGDAARKPPAQPSLIHLAGVRTADATGLAVIRFGLRGPDLGHFWYVRNITVGGLSPTVTAAGRCDVYVIAGGTPMNGAGLTALGLADWRDESLTLPNVAFYGRGELPLRRGETIFLVVSGGTAGQQYAASGQIEDYEEAPIRQGWEM